MVLFLSTLPARGATRRVQSVRNHPAISIHAPREGSDNPTPVSIMHAQISIHAPREGSDGRGWGTGTAHRYFYPRSPRGERRLSCTGWSPSRYFYPRSPRGERHTAPSAALMSTGISIHAPREGSDASTRSRVCWPYYFYPRSPRGERRSGGCILRHVRGISIHAPREGSDISGISPLRLRRISIHAPREGSDTAICISGMPVTNFYPRSPRGERLSKLFPYTSKRNFYPRSPRGERRKAPLFFRSASGNFYPRSPRGERPGMVVIGLSQLNFYPRSPRGERPLVVLVTAVDADISIHAPREGSDGSVCGPFPGRRHFYPRSPRGERQGRSRRWRGSRTFLSTLPARGATLRHLRQRLEHRISIHAPREGSDFL